MTQKQKEAFGGDKPQDKKLREDTGLAEKAKQAKDLLKKLDKAQERKGGRYVVCCGVRTWVPD